MKRFTFIADCDGGFYASQHDGGNSQLALFDWIRNLPSELRSIVYGGSESFDIEQEIQNLDEEMTRLEPTNGLKNVWGGYLEINSKDIYIFAIQTDTD